MVPTALVPGGRVPHQSATSIPAWHKRALGRPRGSAADCPGFPGPLAVRRARCSEVRLLEITEGLCGSSDFECHSLLEEHEGHLEAWWLRL